jgi:hypothetical protein
VYTPLPPLAVTVAVPFDNPHVASVEEMVHIGLLLPLIVTEHDVVHPLESVTTTLYAPGVNPLIVGVVAPLLHKYVYTPLPPLTVAITVPFANPHVVSVDIIVQAGAVLPFILTEHDVVHPFESVTTTLYVPDVKPVIVCVVIPLLHK